MTTKIKLTIPRRILNIDDTTTFSYNKDIYRTQITDLLNDKELKRNGDTQIFEISEHDKDNDYHRFTSFKLSLINDKEDIIPKKYTVLLKLKVFYDEKYASSTSHPEKDKCEDDDKGDDLSKLINNWIEHRKIFSGNIIDIFMYGVILNKSQVYLGSYYITRRYDTFNLVEYSFTHERKLEELTLCQNIFKFIKKLIDNKYTCINFNVNNLGVELIDDNNYEIILLNYDVDSLQKIDEINKNYIELREGDVEQAYYMIFDVNSLGYEELNQDSILNDKKNKYIIDNIIIELNTKIPTTQTVEEKLKLKLSNYYNVIRNIDAYIQHSKNIIKLWLNIVINSYVLQKFDNCGQSNVYILSVFDKDLSSLSSLDKYIILDTNTENKIEGKLENYKEYLISSSDIHTILTSLNELKKICNNKSNLNINYLIDIANNLFYYKMYQSNINLNDFNEIKYIHVKITDGTGSRCSNTELISIHSLYDIINEKKEILIDITNKSKNELEEIIKNLIELNNNNKKHDYIYLLGLKDVLLHLFKQSLEYVQLKEIKDNNTSKNIHMNFKDLIYLKHYIDRYTFVVNDVTKKYNNETLKTINKIEINNDIMNRDKEYPFKSISEYNFYFESYFNDIMDHPIDEYKILYILYDIFTLCLTNSYIYIEQKISLLIQKKIDLLEKIINEEEIIRKKKKTIEIPDNVTFLSSHNLGNSCYFNAVLQMLRHIPEFYSLLTSDKPLTHKLIDNKKETIITNLLGIFKEYKEKLSSSSSSISILPQHESITNVCGFDKRQQDPQEFYIQIFDSIVSKGLSYLSFIRFDQHKILRCNDVDPNNDIFIHNQMDKQQTLELPITGINISDSLMTYLVEEENKDEVFDKCKNNDKFKQQLKSYLPDECKNLIIQLKRFSSSSGVATKLHKEVTPELKLNICGFIFVRMGCIIHKGSTPNGGHYVYVAFNNDNKTLTLCDDSIITKNIDISKTDNLKQIGIYNMLKDGYVYYYRRVEFPEDLPISSPSSGGSIGGNINILNDPYYKKYLKYKEKYLKLKNIK